jgi:hypothetical protein
VSHLSRLGSITLPKSANHRGSAAGNETKETPSPSNQPSL